MSRRMNEGVEFNSSYLEQWIYHFRWRDSAAPAQDTEARLCLFMNDLQRKEDSIFSGPYLAHSHAVIDVFNSRQRALVKGGEVSNGYENIVRSRTSYS